MSSKERKVRLNATALASCAVAAALGTPGHAAGPVSPISADVSPLYGKINPFYEGVGASWGKINPFYGKINPFYGKINPFFGDVTAYWGKINPFIQTSDPDMLAFYGANYDAFWGSPNPYKANATGLDYSSLNGFWGKEFAAWAPTLNAWNSASTAADAAAVATQIQNGLLAPAYSFWNPVLARSPGQRTSAQQLLAADLAKAGVRLNADGTIDSASLLGTDPSARAMLFLNIYDDLMDYAGTGHADWWMGSVGWSPALAQTEGATPANGVSPTIGMIDFVIVNGKHVPRQIVQYGSTVFSDGHGAAVGSLLIGGVDGSGVLGVMPQGSATVAVYDPYDGTDTTNWTDVGIAVATLNKAIFQGRTVPLGVLNASLGEPGWTLSPGWNDALRNAGAGGRDLVVAAGNDGRAQTQNVRWDFASNPTLIIVGSVGADGTISNFSNRPGEACLLRDGASACNEGDKLKYHFIVAPGELILVSDGLGGHVRRSGTSLAAPLVSGAIALLQNRWPWLSNYPEETAQILFRSATPKGANPGADPVYGVGELNIAASQAPLNWASLVYYQASNGKVDAAPLPLSTVIAQISGGTQSSWNASGLWYSAIEKIGGTWRDFQIPLSSRLVGQTVMTAAGGQAYQSYLASALRAQAGHFATLAPGGSAADGDMAASGFARSLAPAGQFGGMRLRVSIRPAQIGNAFRLGATRFETDALLATDRTAIQFGYGNAAVALDGGTGFAFRSDYDLDRGGANPLLGLASGGAYLGARMNIAPGLTIGLGTTDRSSPRNLSAMGLQREAAGTWIDRYAAQAQTVTVAYAFSPRLTARASITRLHEDSALLGIQSLDRTDLRGGSDSDSMSAGVDLAIGRNWSLSATGSLVRSRSDRGQIRTHNLTSASAAVALTRSHLLTSRDELRLLIASPLHAIGGHLSYSSVGVIDRDTGALGVITQDFRPAGGRPLAGEMLYGVTLPRSRGELSLFGRVDRSAQITGLGAATYTGGAQLRLAF